MDIERLLDSRSESEKVLASVRLFERDVDGDLVCLLLEIVHEAVGDLETAVRERVGENEVERVALDLVGVADRELVGGVRVCVVDGDVNVGVRVRTWRDSEVVADRNVLEGVPFVLVSLCDNVSEFETVELRESDNEKDPADCDSEAL